MGYSAGEGLRRWVNQSPDRFAAAAPCGFTGGSANDDAKLANLPIWTMAGSEIDEESSWSQKNGGAIEAAGNVNVKHTEFEGADHRVASSLQYSRVSGLDVGVRAIGSREVNRGEFGNHTPSCSSRSLPCRRRRPFNRKRKRVPKNNWRKFSSVFAADMDQDGN